MTNIGWMEYEIDRRHAEQAKDYIQRYYKGRTYVLPHDAVFSIVSFSRYGVAMAPSQDVIPAQGVAMAQGVTLSLSSLLSSLQRFMDENDFMHKPFASLPKAQTTEDIIAMEEAVKDFVIAFEASLQR